MRKKILLYFMVLITIFSVFLGCTNKDTPPPGEDNSGYTYKKLAIQIADGLGIKGYDKNYTATAAFSADEQAKVNAVLSRGIFGKLPANYVFESSKEVTNLDLSKIAVTTYAALKGIAEENVAPGLKSGATDIGALSVEKRWYVHAANSLGLFTVGKDKLFKPSEKAEFNDGAQMLENVKTATRITKAPNYEAYLQSLADNFKTLPTVSANPARSIGIIKYSPTTKGASLATASVQALANRVQPTIYYPTAGGQSYAWQLEYILSKFPSSEKGTEYTSLNQLITANKAVIKGAVIYDDKRLYTVNNATMLAAINDSIIIDKSMEETVKSLGITNIIDLTDKYTNISQATTDAYNTCFEYLRRDAVNYMYYQGTSHDFERDYAIQMKLPALWTPGGEEHIGDIDPAITDRTEDIEQIVTDILRRLPPNIPIFGFQSGIVGGQEVGMHEMGGNIFCGKSGKYTTVTDWGANYSFHSGIKTSAKARKYESKAPKLTYDSTKKYVQLDMVESGDSPGYVAYNLNGMQWSDAERGTQAPFSIGLGLSNYDILPTYIQYFFESAKPLDSFFAAMSGLGYFYPMERWGFGTVACINDDGQEYTSRESILTDHYKKVNWQMKKMGLNALGVYGHCADSNWRQEDYALFENVIGKLLTECKVIYADMGRSMPLRKMEYVYKKLSSGQTVFNSMFFWARGLIGNGSATSGNEYLNYNFNDKGYINGQSLNDPKNLGHPSNRARDIEAVDFMANEILMHTLESNAPQLFKDSLKFYAGLSYSWNFGPRRLKLVYDSINKTNPGEYVFVTSDQFIDLWEQANK